jgi:flavodoxin
MQDLRLRRRTPQGARTLAAPARHARQLATLAMARALRCRAALFIATGQDVADVAESHAGIVYTQLLSPWQAQSCTGTGSLRTSSMGETAVDHRLPSGDRDSSWHITCVLDGVHSREALMRKILVVCYSRQGTTLRLAQEIAAALNADFERIEEVWQRKGVFGFVLSSLEAMAKGLPSIRTRKDPSNYDLVVLGTPTWAQSISAPMRAYLFLHRDQLRSTAFFATMGGFGAENALHEMKLLCDANDAPTCSFVEREVKANQYQSKLQQFVAAVRLASASGSARSTAAA